jgi:hypothetical protein
MGGLKTEIQLEMNARKEESGGDLKDLDMKMMVSLDGVAHWFPKRLTPCDLGTDGAVPAPQELNNKFIILLGEVRTEIEATKWISTRECSFYVVQSYADLRDFQSIFRSSNGSNRRCGRLSYRIRIRTGRRVLFSRVSSCRR